MLIFVSALALGAFVNWAEAILDLRKIARSQDESSRAKTVLYEGGVVIATSREEKRFVAEIIRSGGEGALRKSSIVRRSSHDHLYRSVAWSVLAQKVARVTRYLCLWF